MLHAVTVCCLLWLCAREAAQPQDSTAERQASRLPAKTGLLCWLFASMFQSVTLLHYIVHIN